MTWNPIREIYRQSGSEMRRVIAAIMDNQGSNTDGQA
jgi:hypothetical protein